MTNEQQRFDEMAKQLYSAVICDALDELGYRNQAMKSQLHSLTPGCVLAGRAKTILAVDVTEIKGNPYEHEIKAVDSIQNNEVVVICTNGSANSGIWGELLTVASMNRGARGALVDGLIRDTRKIKELNFPVFFKGTNPLDSQGRTYVIDYDVKITCGGITVAPNDVVYADEDGIVVIPQEVLEPTLERAYSKVQKENTTRNELKAGKLLQDVYNKYGVL